MIRRLIARGHQSESGQAAIMLALMLVALIGFCGLTLDYGRAALAHRAAQNAADGAAQAAATDIYLGDDEATATTFAGQAMTQHGLPTADLTQLSYLDSTYSSTSTASSVNYVQSQVSESIPTTLLSILGIRTISVSASAQLKVGAGGSSCAFCLLSLTQGLTASGSENYNVTGGDIWINAAGTSATSSGSEKISASEIGMNGGYTYSGGNPFTPAPLTNAGTVPDPLANVPAPSVTGPSYGTPVYSGSGRTVTLSPGIYSGIILSGSGTVNFSPGIYVFTGGITISGTWAFDGTGVMIYLTCSSYSSTKTQPCNGAAGAGLTWSGSTTYNLTAPTSGTYKGLAIYYDRTNSAGITLSGSPSDSLTGTIYAKDSAMTLSGTPGISQLNSLVVVGSATVSGSGTLNLVYNQDENYGAAQAPVFTQ
ncbi:MAG TPA: pilus assembly protein TadG-related protein [Chloroflexota bacterium]|nr:pilus assembly protein TadG-related protein [Chloroflexota bacterium]